MAIEANATNSASVYLSPYSFATFCLASTCQGGTAANRLSMCSCSCGDSLIFAETVNGESSSAHQLLIELHCRQLVSDSLQFLLRSFAKRFVSYFHVSRRVHGRLLLLKSRLDPDKLIANIIDVAERMIGRRVVF